jgi:hypothetical protein
MESLKADLAALTPDDRRLIIAYAIGLQANEEASYREELHRLIDERDPQSWVSFNEVDQRFDISVDESAPEAKP